MSYTVRQHIFESVNGTVDISDSRRTHTHTHAQNTREDSSIQIEDQTTHIGFQSYIMLTRISFVVCNEIVRLAVFSTWKREAISWKRVMKSACVWECTSQWQVALEPRNRPVKDREPVPSYCIILLCYMSLRTQRLTFIIRFIILKGPLSWWTPVNPVWRLPFSFFQLVAFVFQPTAWLIWWPLVFFSRKVTVCYMCSTKLQQ